VCRCESRFFGYEDLDVIEPEAGEAEHLQVDLNDVGDYPLLNAILHVQLIYAHVVALLSSHAHLL
jgi:hypothetical protein